MSLTVGVTLHLQLHGSAVLPQSQSDTVTYIYDLHSQIESFLFNIALITEWRLTVRVGYVCSGHPPSVTAISTWPSDMFRSVKYRKHNAFRRIYSRKNLNIIRKKNLFVISDFNNV